MQTVLEGRRGDFQTVITRLDYLKVGGERETPQRTLFVDVSRGESKERSGFHLHIGLLGVILIVEGERSKHTENVLESD